jgi:hypothetical protein
MFMEGNVEVLMGDGGVRCGCSGGGEYVEIK